MHLFCSPTFRQIEPTSKRQHSPFNILNDDALLHIFYLYWLHIKDEYEGEDGRQMYEWPRQRWWYKLVQVSRRWRYLIFESRSLLDLHLVCTFGVPVAHMLAHSLPLPLSIFYDGKHIMTAEDEQGLLLALSHRDRVRRILLQLQTPDSEKFMPAMDGQFPILERLHIYSLTEEGTDLTLPVTFQAPNLRRLNLWYTALPTTSPLLTSNGGLVHLSLADIPRSAYFPPNYIHSRLSLMPQLERLTITFQSPLPNHDVVSQLLDTPILTNVTLPNLRFLQFSGVSAYLEGLLARISTPVLSVLIVLFSNQLTCTVPRLSQTIKTSENLRLNSVHVVFFNNFIGLIVDPHRGRWKRPLDLRIMCRDFDSQVASAIQILATLSQVLSVVEVLTLHYKGYNRLSGSQVDRTQWRELLRPFTNVKVLQLQYGLAERVSHSLCSEDGEMTLDVLPNLEELTYSGGDVGGAITSFINERQAAGHTVRLESRFPRW
jgi:hypothetical protein